MKRNTTSPRFAARGRRPTDRPGTRPSPARTEPWTQITLTGRLRVHPGWTEAGKQRDRRLQGLADPALLKGPLRCRAESRRRRGAIRASAPGPAGGLVAEPLV